MPFFRKDFTTNLLAAIILYATVLVYQGYQYGQGDQTQILPCLWAQDHPGAYANDHYVQNYLASGTNERTIFHFLLRYFGYERPWLVWLWHATSGIGLILAWIYIASCFIKNRSLQWICIGLILTLGFHTSTGSNELYYNSFIPSVPAKALASWAIYFWLKEKYGVWSVLLILAGLLQPLVGLQVFLFTTIALLLESWRKGGTKLIPWKSILLFMSGNIIWFYLLISNNGSHSDPKTFMDIMEFRLSHHFFASYFGWIHLLIGLIFAITCITFYSGKLRYAFLAIVACCGIYEIGVEIFRLPLVLYTQWWKTTIWVEAFAFVAIISYLEKVDFINVFSKKLSLILPALLLAFVCFYRLSGSFGAKPDYMFPWSSSISDEVAISKMAFAKTPESAVFIVPPDLTAFRWYSKRSSYVDYKAMIHTEAFLKEWYERIGNVYDYNLASKKIGVNFSEQAERLLSSLSSERIEQWKSMGITHIISPVANLPNLLLIGKNDSFGLYQIP
ncbi:MAG: DUF6798 domain-containing protein [Saprospiraceae bacterium]